MKTMTHYFILYRAFLKSNWRFAVVNRGNTLFEAFGSLGWGLFGIFTTIIITSKVKMVFGWSREELIFLAALFTTVHGTLRGLFITNFRVLSEIIQFGGLDQLLIKPVDFQFLATLRYFSFHRLSRLLMGMIVIPIIVLKLKIPIFLTLNKLLFFSIGLGFWMMIFYSYFVFTAVLVMKNPRLTNVNEFTNNLIGNSKYPPELLRNSSVILYLVFLPIAILVATPARVILGKAFITELILMGIVAIFLVISSRILFNHSIKNYTSAN